MHEGPDHRPDDRPPERPAERAERPSPVGIAPQEPVLRRVLEVWQAAWQGGDPPERRAVDPVDLGPALPHLWTCERDPGGQRFRYRLAGERINDIYKRNLAGWHLDEIIPEPGLTIVQRRYATVVDAPALLHTSGLVYLRNDRTFRGERVILPAVDRESGCAIVIGATVYALVPSAALSEPQQITTIWCLRPRDGERGWVEDESGERVATLS